MMMYKHRLPNCVSDVKQYTWEMRTVIWENRHWKHLHTMIMIANELASVILRS